MRKFLVISFLAIIAFQLRAQESADGFSLDRMTELFESRSLLGMKAEPLVLEDQAGNSVSLYGRDRYSVLFFYDTGCPKCTAESVLLRPVLENCDRPVDLYAIYVGSDRSKWERFVTERFGFDAPGLSIFNLWDPARELDFQMKYGVIGTPRMFLVRPDRTITGRLLTSGDLEKLLRQEFGEQKLEYGSKDSADFFDIVFSPFDGAPGAEDLLAVAGHIASRTLGEARDTSLFRQMEGDLLYYITNRREEGFKNGAEAFVDGFILSRPDIWRSADDSLKVVGLASMLKGLVSKSPVGTRVPDIRVRGIAVRGGSPSKKGLPAERNLRLRGLHGQPAVLLFHVDGCEFCRKEIEASREWLKGNRKAKLVLIRGENVAQEAVDAFDLSCFPHLVELDRKGTITRKYFSLSKEL